MIFSATEYSKIGNDSTAKTMQITEQQRLFILSLLQDINGVSVFVDRDTFNEATTNEASDMIDDLRSKILTAI